MASLGSVGAACFCDICALAAEIAIARKTISKLLRADLRIMSSEIVIPALERSIGFPCDLRLRGRDAPATAGGTPALLWHAGATLPPTHLVRFFRGWGGVRRVYFLWRMGRRRR